ncbi:MAG: hypothetical protein P1V97_36965 [Planctomycetota bacterium]|nr:hypothetical protein [Planctomycetota bacterium]
MTVAIFPIKVVNKHIILLLPEGPCLLDTGSPYCIGARSFQFLGQDRRKAEDFMGIALTDLGPHIGADIEFLIGANALETVSFVIDWERLEFRVSEDPLCLEGVKIELEMTAPVPIVNPRVNGISRRLFFDTGAQISYLNKVHLADLKSQETVKDFHPSIGEYETPSYSLDVRFSPKLESETAMAFGVLPEVLERALLPSKVDGIIGSEIFETHLGGFDYRESLMILQPRR